jgi:hypothetical protein
VVLRSQVIPSIEPVIPIRTVAIWTGIYFRLVGNKPRWIRFAHVYGHAERVVCGTTVNSIIAPNHKNRDHGQGGIECTHPP